MKNLLLPLLVMLSLFYSGCVFSESPSTAAATASVRTSVPMSSVVREPSVIDSTRSVTLEFLAPLEFESVSGEIRLHRVKSSGETVEEPIVTTFDPGSPALLKISRKDGSDFIEGEQYKLTVGPGVKLTGGLSAGTGFTGYFAVNYSFVPGAEGVKDMNGERSLIICISDIHLGADLKYSEFDRGGKGNGAALTDFLNRIRRSPNVKELVIAGDLLDEWFVPSDVDTFQGKNQADFVARIAASNKNVIDAFNNIIRDGRIKVTYVPGNHDLLITASDVESILPGISQARDVRGLGVYSPADRPEIAFEHGHRYNYFCAPDPISNRGITGTDSILPPGYFFTRVATTSVVERMEGKPVKAIAPPEVGGSNLSGSQELLYYYYKSFKDILASLPIAEGFNDKIIKTNIDGFTAAYALSDIFPYQAPAGGAIDVNLFKGAESSWSERCRQNRVQVAIPVKDAILNAAYSTDLDEKADSQYFKNAASNKRIVVFGHTHVPLIKTSSDVRSRKTIYANSGTWIDHNLGNTTMHFVVIAPPKAGGSAPEFVSLYTYSSDGTITRTAAPQAITDIER